MDDNTRMQVNAGIISENDAPVTAKYKIDLMDRGWIVTPDQAATIGNAQERIIPLAQQLSNEAQQLSIDGMLTPEEKTLLRQSIELLKSLQIPLTLLKVQEPRRLKLPGM